MTNKKASPKRTLSKQPTEFTLTCRCGAKARVFSIGEKGFTAHCPACGSVTFFRSTDLLERLKYSGALCPHNIETKHCRGGQTTWCPICRIRTFYPEVA